MILTIVFVVIVMIALLLKPIEEIIYITLFWLGFILVLYLVLKSFNAAVIIGSIGALAVLFGIDPQPQQKVYNNTKVVYKERKPTRREKKELERQLRDREIDTMLQAMAMLDDDEEW